MNTSSKTKQLTLNALLIAMTTVLGYLSIDAGSIKITLESLPILLAGLLFGPFTGLMVGGFGTLLYQLIRYGITVTTPLWIIPYVVGGLICGAYARKKSYDLKYSQTLFILICSEFCITALNTIALYIDSHIYGYYYPAFITAMLIPRFLLALGKGLAFSAIMPILTKNIRPLIK
jgi:ECF transporter S component (folate family)